MQRDPLGIKKSIFENLGATVRKSFEEGYRQNQTSQLMSSNSTIVGIVQKRHFKPVVIWEYVYETSEDEDKELKRLGITPGDGLYVSELLPKFYLLSHIHGGKMRWQIIFPDESKSSMFYSSLEGGVPDVMVRDIIMATLYPELLVAERLGLEEKKIAGARRVKRNQDKPKEKPKRKAKPKVDKGEVLAKDDE